MCEPDDRALTLGLLATIGLSGCDNGASSSGERGPALQANDTGGLFNSVAENLEHLEQYETDQIHKQLCDRLNQWVLQEKPKFAWSVDPLVGNLSESARKAPRVAAARDIAVSRARRCLVPARSGLAAKHLEACPRRPVSGPGRGRAVVRLDDSQHSAHR